MNGQTKLVIRGAVVLLVMAGLGAWLALGHGGQAQPGSTLAIFMTDAPDPVAPGGIVTYTITVENTGATDDDNVVVEDTLTGPGTILSATPSQGSCSPPAATALTCALGSLSPGANATIIVEKLATVIIGGITELLVDGSDAPASAAQGSGSSAPPYAAIAGAAAAALAALTAGGWYARRRLLR